MHVAATFGDWVWGGFVILGSCFAILISANFLIDEEKATTRQYVCASIALATSMLIFVTYLYFLSTFLFLAAVLIIITTAAIWAFRTDRLGRQIEAERHVGPRIHTDPDLVDVLAHRHDQIVERMSQGFPSLDYLTKSIYEQFEARRTLERLPQLPAVIRDKISAAIKEAYDTEFRTGLTPPSRAAFLALAHQAAPNLSEDTRRQIELSENIPAATEAFVRVFVSVLVLISRHLPPTSGSADDTPFAHNVLHLSDIVPNFGEVLLEFADIFWADDVRTLDLFADFRTTWASNRDALSSRLVSGRITEPVRPAVYEKDYGAQPQEVADVYLKGTYFHSLFFAEFPFSLPEAQRLEHTVIVAGSGHGKTQTLEALVVEDLLRSDPPGMVIVDSKGDMITRLAHLRLFNPDDGPRRNKLLIVDPRDGPALSPFDVSIDEIEQLGPERSEEIVNGIISELGYFFRALLGAELSGPMSGVFNPLVQLLIRVPDANLETMAEAVDDPGSLAEKTGGLPDTVRRFLTIQYKELSAKESRTAVKRRIYTLLNSSPSFARMFNARRNNLDLATALNNGTTVLVSTEQNFLHDFSALFGRYVISQAISAARRRAPIREEQRKAAYIIVDEASDYFDDRTETMLRTLRSYRVGGLLAFQDFGRASGSLQSAIRANTSIRLAGGKVDDPKLAATLVHAEPEFVLSRRKQHREFSEFACFVEGMTDHAVSLTIPHGTLDKQPQMTEGQYQRMRATNKAFMTADAKRVPQPEPVRPRQPPPAAGDSDDPTRWG